MESTAQVYDFHHQLKVGEQHERDLDAFFSQFFKVIPVPMAMQLLGIDRIFYRTRTRPHKRFSIEYKADVKAFETNNAFIETVSNDVTGKQGWAYTSCAQELIYYIPQHKRCGVISMLELRSMIRKWEKNFRTVSCKNTEYNSRGILVPLKELKKLMYRRFTVEIQTPSSQPDSNAPAS